jgi:hypothetical protein
LIIATTKYVGCKHSESEIRIYKKSKFEQICFTTPEAAEAITSYRNTRPGAKYFHDVSNKAISATLENLAARAGIIKKGGLGLSTEHRNEVPAVHGLRKFCITQMAKAKVDTEIAKILTGHSIGVRGRYLNYTDDDLLQEYLKAIDLLTINETNRLRREVVDLKEKENETQSLKRQLASYQSEIAELKESIARTVFANQHEVMELKYQLDKLRENTGKAQSRRKKI